MRRTRTKTEVEESSGTVFANLMRGRLSGYSIERLTRLLNALGHDVEIRICPASEGQEKGHLRVAVEG